MCGLIVIHSSLALMETLKNNPQLSGEDLIRLLVRHLKAKITSQLEE